MLNYQRHARHHCSLHSGKRHVEIGYKINSPHSAVPYSFQCERVFAVIAIYFKYYQTKMINWVIWNEIFLSTILYNKNLNRIIKNPW